MNKVSNMLWGVVLVVIGVIFGLNALEITHINLFFDGWWTLFIIVPCFIGLFQEKEKTGNLIGLIIGCCLLLGCLEVISFDLIWKLLLPTVLVLIGLSFIFKDILQRNFKTEIGKLAKKDGNQEYCATFAGQDVDFSGEEFTGCSLSAVFGGVKCDLRNAKIKEDAVIYASAIFGGITILVPDDVRVKISSTPIFGGVSDERKTKNDGKYTIYINATSIFGGVEVK